MKTSRVYIIGFGLSILLTLAAFGLAEQHLLTHHVFPSHTFLLPALVVLALAQLLVQLICFLHIGKGGKEQGNVVVLFFAVFIVVVLVGGTLWIMHNLEHQQMTNPEAPYIGNVISPQTEND